MDRGEVIALDTPRNLVKSLHSDSAIEFRLPQLDTLSDEEKFSIHRMLQDIDAVKSVDSRKDNFILYTDQLQPSLIDLIRKAADHELNFTELATRTATLEDVFIHMTGRSLREE